VGGAVPSVALLRRLETAFEIVFAAVAVDRSGFESEAEPATEVELVLAAAAAGRSGFESEFEDPVDRQLLRLGRGVAVAVFCIAVETLSAGLAVDSPVYMLRDTKQQPPRSPVLLPKPVKRPKYIHCHQHTTILWLSVKTY
jgi:hypothetical protein